MSVSAGIDAFKLTFLRRFEPTVASAPTRRSLPDGKKQAGGLGSAAGPGAASQVRRGTLGLDHCTVQERLVGGLPIVPLTTDQDHCS